MYYDPDLAGYNTYYYGYCDGVYPPQSSQRYNEQQIVYSQAVNTSSNLSPSWVNVSTVNPPCFNTSPVASITSESHLQPCYYNVAKQYQYQQYGQDWTAGVVQHNVGQYAGCFASNIHSAPYIGGLVSNTGSTAISAGGFTPKTLPSVSSVSSLVCNNESLEPSTGGVASITPSASYSDRRSCNTQLSGTSTCDIVCNSESSVPSTNGLAFNIHSLSSTGGLASSTQPSAPSTGGLAPNMQSSSPSTGGLAPNTQSSTLSTDRFSPNTQSSVPSTDRFASNTQSSAPSTDRFAPNTQSSAPSTDRFASNTQSSAPSTDTQSSTPSTDRFAPNTQSSAPSTDRFAPNTQSSAPSTDRFASNTQSSAPSTDRFASNTQSSAPSTDRFASNTQSSAPSTDRFASNTQLSALSAGGLVSNTAALSNNNVASNTQSTPPFNGGLAPDSQSSVTSAIGLASNNQPPAPSAADVVSSTNSSLQSGSSSDHRNNISVRDKTVNIPLSDSDISGKILTGNKSPVRPQQTVSPHPCNKPSHRHRVPNWCQKPQRPLHPASAALTFHQRPLLTTSSSPAACHRRPISSISSSPTSHGLLLPVSRPSSNSEGGLSTISSPSQGDKLILSSVSSLISQNPTLPASLAPAHSTERPLSTTSSRILGHVRPLPPALSRTRKRKTCPLAPVLSPAPCYQGSLSSVPSLTPTPKRPLASQAACNSRTSCLDQKSDLQQVRSTNAVLSTDLENDTTEGFNGMFRYKYDITDNDFVCLTCSYKTAHFHSFVNHLWRDFHGGSSVCSHKYNSLRHDSHCEIVAGLMNLLMQKQKMNHAADKPSSVCTTRLKQLVHDVNIKCGAIVIDNILLAEEQGRNESTSVLCDDDDIGYLHQPKRRGYPRAHRLAVPTKPKQELDANLSQDNNSLHMPTTLLSNPPTNPTGDLPVHEQLASGALADRIQHTVDEQKILQEEKPQIAVKTECNLETLICPLCDVTCTKKSEMRRHMCVQHGDEGDLADNNDADTKSSTALKLTEAEQENCFFLCPGCFFTCAKLSVFRDHIQTHNIKRNVRFYHCGHCQTVTNVLNKMEDHLPLLHPGMLKTWEVTEEIFETKHADNEVSGVHQDPWTDSVTVETNRNVIQTTSAQSIPTDCKSTVPTISGCETSANPVGDEDLLDEDVFSTDEYTDNEDDVTDMHGSVVDNGSTRESDDDTSVRWFSCDLCPYRTTVSELFQRHRSNIHKTQDSLRDVHLDDVTDKHGSVVDNGSTRESDDDTSVRWFSCDLCPYRTTVSEHFQRHRSNIHKTQDSLRDVHLDDVTDKHGSVVDNGSTRESDDDTSVRWFSCDLCPYRTTVSELFQRHRSNIHKTQDSLRDVHLDNVTDKHGSVVDNGSTRESDDDTSVRWFSCNLCPYRTTVSEHFQRHKSNIHKTQDSLRDVHQCRFCAFRTPDRYLLMLHQKRYHPGDGEIILYYRTDDGDCKQKQVAETSIGCPRIVDTSTIRQPNLEIQRNDVNSISEVPNRIPEPPPERDTPLENAYVSPQPKTSLENLDVTTEASKQLNDPGVSADPGANHQGRPRSERYKLHCRKGEKSLISSDRQRRSSMDHDTPPCLNGPSSIKSVESVEQHQERRLSSDHDKSVGGSEGHSSVNSPNRVEDHHQRMRSPELDQDQCLEGHPSEKSRESPEPQKTCQRRASSDQTKRANRSEGHSCLKSFKRGDDHRRRLSSEPDKIHCLEGHRSEKSPESAKPDQAYQEKPCVEQDTPACLNLDEGEGRSKKQGPTANNPRCTAECAHRALNRVHRMPNDIKDECPHLPFHDDMREILVEGLGQPGLHNVLSDDSPYLSDTSDVSSAFVKTRKRCSYTSTESTDLSDTAKTSIMFAKKRKYRKRISYAKYHSDSSDSTTFEDKRRYGKRTFQNRRGRRPLCSSDREKFNGDKQIRFKRHRIRRRRKHRRRVAISELDSELVPNSPARPKITRTTLPSYSHPIEIYLCAYCGKSFTMIYTLRNHSRRHHPLHSVCWISRPLIRLTGLGLALDRDSPVQPKRYTCGVQTCKTLCRTQASLVRHINREHVADNGVYRCTSCSFITFMFSEYAAHIRRHTPRISYICQQCGFQSDSYDSVNRHARRQHRQSTPKILQDMYFGTLEQAGIWREKVTHFQPQVKVTDLFSMSDLHRQRLLKKNKVKTAILQYTF